MKKILKKEKGAADNFLYALFTTIILFVFLIALFPNFSLLHMKSEVNQIARGYILRMESTGCLMSDDAINMKTEIMKINGVNDVIIQSNHMEANRADYGEDIQLTITVQFQMENYNLNNILSPELNNEIKTYVFKKSTTAKNSKNIN